MKTTVIILSTIALLSISACNQDPNITDVLENPESRSELFNTIAKNHKFMSQFLETMKGDTHAMMMMQGDYMQKMKDSTMMHAMMGKMMKDGNMMHHMMQMMHKEGIMSNDCMQSCMKIMGDKAMMMNGKSKEDLKTYND
jgi:hypothetical protein